MRVTSGAGRDRQQRRDRAAHRTQAWFGWALLAIVNVVPLSAQWTAQSPLPTHLPIRGVAAPAGGHLFLATDDDSFDNGGALFESSDGGATWIQREIPVDLGSGLWGIDFLDADRGWVWGNVNYRTLDGGATWEELPLLGSTYEMRFHSPNFGVATGNFGVARSLDGGTTWALPADGMDRFSFATANVGLGVAADGLYRTSDGGATFAHVREGAAEAVAFLSPSVALAIVHGQLVRSADGGLTWTAQGSALGRTDLVVVSPSIALAWGRTGSAPDFDDRLLRTADGGVSWSDLGEVLPSSELAESMQFVVTSTGVVLAANGDGDLYRSIDGGLSWTRTFVGLGAATLPFSTGAPVFSDATNGYFAAGPGILYRTQDGGETWSQASSGSGWSVEDLDRFPNGDLIAVGEAGQVLFSSGGSGPWRLRALLGAENLQAVDVVGAQSVVAVSSSGRLYRSSDAGLSWTAAATTPTDLIAADLYFDSPLSGWVVGQGFSSGALFHTSDGGASWSPVSAIQGTYVAVDFVGTSGWAAAVYGTIYRSTDAGLHWIEGVLPDAPATLYDLDFWSAGVGYAVGSSGYAARTSDGGANWQILPTPSGLGPLTDIALLGPDELWISSADGKVLYSATGGENWAVMDAGSAGFGAFASLAASPSGDAWIGGWQGRIRRFAGPPPPPVNRPPVADFHYLTTGLSVAFSDRSQDPDGTIASRSWNFGDGSSSNEANPVHPFSAAGSYNVVLTVTDDDGGQAEMLKTLVVQPGPGGTYGEFTEATPLDPWFVTPQDEDFWVSSAAPADFDGDGDVDIAVLGYYVVYNVSAVDHLLLLRNDGPLSAVEWNFSYLELPLGSLTAGASDLAWGDADSDGDPDLAVGSEGLTVLYRNAGGTLVPTNTVLPGYWEDSSQADFDLQSITWADFDNDGDQDLLLPSIWDETTFSSHTALMRNDGSNGSGGWSFVEVDAQLGRSDHAQTRWADDDGDQDLDLFIVHLAPNTGAGFIRRYRNDGGGLFTGEDLLGGLSVEHGEAQWGDYDNDGDLDILVAGNVHEVDDTYATVLRIYRNDGGSYAPLEVIACPACEGWFDLSAATWADYDSDGDIDILLAGTYNSGSQIEGRARVYDNVGGLFVDSGNQLPAPRAMGFSGGSFSWLDIDVDGDLDYFIAGSYFVPGGNGLVETQMHLYVNDATATNLSPTAPFGLDAQTHLDGSVELFWQPATDDLTPQEALSYEVRIYRYGLPATTAHRVPDLGGVRGAGAWAFSGLADGAYAWTLAAVDSALNRGPVASGQFYVGTPPEPIFANGFDTGSTGAWSFVLP